MLEQIAGRHEGFSAGAAGGAASKSQHGARLAGGPDSRAGSIRRRPSRTALGHHLQLVLTEQPESAQQILADLSASKAGRASIAPLAIEYGDGKQLAFDGDIGAGRDRRARRNAARAEWRAAATR